MLVSSSLVFYYHKFVSESEFDTNWREIQEANPAGSAVGLTGLPLEICQHYEYHL
jgi:hypothetical protein